MSALSGIQSSVSAWRSSTRQSTQTLTRWFANSNADGMSVYGAGGRGAALRAHLLVRHSVLLRLHGQAAFAVHLRHVSAHPVPDRILHCAWTHRVLLSFAALCQDIFGILAFEAEAKVLSLVP